MRLSKKSAFMSRIGGAGLVAAFAWGFTMGDASADEIVISELVDGTLPGGQPKWVELTNCGDVEVDLSRFSLGNFNNGGTDLGGGASTPLAGLLPPGASYVVSYEFPPDMGEISVFEEVYGFPPDQFIGPFINGDDVIALFLGPATGDGSDAQLIDVYGVIGVDGTGEVWEYTDGYSFRAAGASPTPVFDPADWVFGGPDSLEGADDDESLQLMLANTTPDEHDCIGPKGACCFPDGTCAVVVMGDCSDGGGVFLGGGVVCTVGLCTQPAGACCFDDGSCTLLDPAGCNAAGADWQGPGVACDPGLCVPAKGACCFADATCSVVPEAVCTQAGGVFNGPGTICVIDLCGQAATCAADFNVDGWVNVEDLTQLISHWGADGDDPCDLNGDAIVDVSDLGMLLAGWGACGGR